MGVGGGGGVIEAGGGEGLVGEGGGWDSVGVGEGDGWAGGWEGGALVTGLDGGGGGFSPGLERLRDNVRVERAWAGAWLRDGGGGAGTAGGRTRLCCSSLARPGEGDGPGSKPT